MEILFTVCSLVCSLAAAWCWERSARKLEGCEIILNDLARTRSKIVGNENAIEELSAKVKQLAGRQYAHERPRPGAVIDNDSGAVVGSTVDPELQAYLDLQGGKPVRPAK